MDKMKKVPDIRFKGYEGEWNETPLLNLESVN